MSITANRLMGPALVIAAALLSGCGGNSTTSALPGKISAIPAGGPITAKAVAKFMPLTTTVTGSGVGQLTEYSGLTSGAKPTQLTFLDGDVWFTECGTNAIGKLGQTNFEEYAIPWSDNAIASGIAVGNNHRIWFTEQGTQCLAPFHTPSTLGSVGELDPSGNLFNEFSLGSSSTAPYSIINGPDNNLYIAQEFQGSGGGIGKVTTDGADTYIGTMANVPVYVANGPDGNIWFTENYNNNNNSGGGPCKIGAINTAGVIQHEYTYVSGSGCYLNDLTFGPDGNIWFVDTYNGSVVRVTTAGVFTAYNISPAYPTSIDVEISAGPTGISDSHVYVTDYKLGKIYQVDMSGTLTNTFSVSSPVGIQAGPDNQVWFTEFGADKIGKVKV